MEKTKEQIKEYNQNYYKNHKDIKNICEICKGKFSVFNKNHHENTKKHLKKLEESKKPSLEEFAKLLLEKSSQLGICNLKVNIEDKTITIQ